MVLMLRIQQRLSNDFRKLAVCLILWANVISSVSGKCSCYSYNPSEISWSRSRSECQKGNGDLVSLETLGEWKFIKDEIQSKSTHGKVNEWWIGLKYDDTDKQWKWLSNITLTYYSAWQKNKPESESKKTCALIAKEFPPGHKGSFNNVRSSSLSRGFICEYTEFTMGQRACMDNKQLQWCSPTMSTRRPTTQTSTSPVTTSIIPQTSTITSTNTARNMNPASSSSQPSEATSPFPVYIIIIILLILLAVAFALAVFIYRLKKKRELKPRNSHLSKGSRVPVKLDHSSSSDNLNDKIIYADVVNMDGQKIQINCHSVDVPAPKTNVNKTSPYCSNGVIYSNLTNEEKTSYGEKNEKNMITTCLYANIDQSNTCELYEEQDSQKSRLLYVQIADLKESNPASPPPTMPAAYSETDYAVITSTNLRLN